MNCAVDVCVKVWDDKSWVLFIYGCLLALSHLVMFSSFTCFLVCVYYYYYYYYYLCSNDTVLYLNIIHFISICFGFLGNQTLCISSILITKINIEV